MKELARKRFRDFGIVLPMSWRAPQGPTATEQFRDAFAAKDRSVEPEPAGCLFRSATRNRLHVAAAVEMSKLIGDFLDGVCVAVCRAWATWQAQATMSGIVVNGPVAAGGRLSGPGWEQLILQHAPRAHEGEVRYSAAVAKVFGKSWALYEATVKVLGLPWYPSFVLAFGAAPPTANVPTPLATLAQVTTMLATRVQTEQLCAELGEPGANHHKEVFESLAHALEQCFSEWQKTTTVTRVMGQGPASPLGGPVVGGSASMSAGGMV